MTNAHTVNQAIPLLPRGYRIARAVRRDEIAAVLHRRHVVFAERMHAFPTNRQRFELDLFDVQAEHIYASLDGIVVGSVRLVRDTAAGFPLEGEGAQVPSFLPRATTIEGGRFNAERIPGYNVAADLMQAVYRWSRRHGISYWIGIENADSLRFLLRQGWPIQRFGEPIEHAGVPYFPHFLCLADVARLRRHARLSCH